MEKPWVSVICLCYNQRPFVRESIQSVLDQDYPNIEVIVVDDASTDGSADEIKDFLKDKPDVHFVSLEENLGNTSAFNQGFVLAKGKYIIDLACDDVMVTTRISSQVAFFESQDRITGVVYSDADYIDERGSFLSRHFRSDAPWEPHSGNIYSELVAGYFIHPATMMIKKQVLDDLGGYDESLAYEDFDFWVRSSRMWNYAYQDEVLTRVRKVKNSLSNQLYRKNDDQLESTVKVCKNIMKMNQSSAENEALVIRLKYEIKHAFLTGHKEPVSEFLKILDQLDAINGYHRWLRLLNWGINFSLIRRLGLRLKYNSTRS